LIVLGAVVIAALAGWLAGRLIQSPAEAAARRAAPELTPILVAAEERELSTDLVTRGTARFGSAQTLAIVPSELKSGEQIVTELPDDGAELAEGDVALTVSGRPVFLLEGAAPSYRDLGPGMIGEDIRQLEEALERLGFDPGAADGVFDASTEAAVVQLYREAGFEPVTATEEQLAGVRPLEADLVANARAGAGVQVPADEVVFVEGAPVRVTEATVEPGDPPKGPLLTVTDVAVAVDSSVPIEEAPLLKPGMRVILDEPDLGIDEMGVVSQVAEGPGTNDLDGFHVYFEVAVDGSPAALVGASVRVTVPIESTQGAVLTVPVSALSLGPDGSSRVQKSTGGKLEFVTVEPGLSAGGYVEVTPVDGTLEAGDQVVIGFENAGG
jgi:peptidoglycan hydrolase-like protein with peptidoglycan-binding domain